MGISLDIRLRDLEIMRTFALLLALLVASTYAGDILDLIEDCGSTGGKITAMSFEGCDAEDDDECEAIKGTTVIGQMTFAASAATASLECSIYGIIFGVEIPFPGGCPVVDACSTLSQGDCPIEAGEEFVYDLSIKIENIFPAGSVTGKWTLKDPNGDNFVCFLIPIMISS